jgi:arylsulfatase A-like enzyme
MRRKCVWAVVFLLFFLGTCSKMPVQEKRLYRFIDLLVRENILLSPLMMAQEESQIFPSTSRPLEDAGSGENPAGIKRKIKLGGTDRNILFCPPASHLRFKMEHRGNWRLEFGIGIVTEDGAVENQSLSEMDRKGTTFTVSLETKGKRKTVFQKYLPPPPDKGSPSFSWHNLELPDIQEPVDVSFITQGDEHNKAFWYDPLLYRPQENARRIILISIDTLRADHLGCYGYPRNTSPQIDLLASDSVTFLDTYAASPWTLPSHVSLLTSLYSVHHQVYYDDESMDPALVTLADVLRQQNFYCAAFTGGGFVSSVYGFSKGFDSYSDDAGSVFRQDSAEHLFHLASEWLESHKDQSFFLFLHTYQPHNPYACPFPYKTMFLEEAAQWRHLDLTSYLGGKPGVFRKLTDDERRNVIGLYNGEIRYTDEKFIGPLIERLKEIGIYDQTMIVFTSDHGEEFFDHGGWGHGHSLYDESLKVPLIIKFPASLYKGQRVSSVVSLVDVFPTILEEMGVGASELNIDGRSLFPLIRGKERGDRESLADIAPYILDSHIPQKIAMNKGKEKLILNKKFTPEDIGFFIASPPSLDPVEIYDLGQDPKEQHNIANRRAELANQIIERINQIYQEAKKRNTKKLVIDEELRKQLKALGYIR